ncbi:MAG TPA: ABC transporter permease [Pseudoflavonifractor sp.]|nr:ABC transporter permease [Pseudoflavonifractor sp.]
MKLTASLSREFTLLSRSLYFYAELIMTVLLLTILLFVVPEHFDGQSVEYFYLDMSGEETEFVQQKLLDTSEGITSMRTETLNIRGQKIDAMLYESDEKLSYQMPSRESLIAACEDTGDIGSVISLSKESGQMKLEIYLQGYETQRFQNAMTLLTATNLAQVTKHAENQPVITLGDGGSILSDRQNILPIALTVNSVFMGVFVTAAHIVEDKKSKTIKALRVVPTSIIGYLLAKMLTVLITSLAGCMVITAPVMGAQANYLLLAAIVLCGGFFVVALGTLLASFYSDMNKAFVGIASVLMVFLIPTMLTVIPGLSAWWMQLLPSTWVVQSVKAALLNTDAGYVLLCSAVFLAAGLALLPLCVRRYKAAGMGG